jgi:hypothetical protein
LQKLASLVFATKFEDDSDSLEKIFLGMKQPGDRET